MNKALYRLLIAQFLSVLADNMLLFTVIALVLHDEHATTWYVPALQSVFIVAFVILAPWVGGIADGYAKSRVLIVANLIKAIGVLLLLSRLEPLIAYAIVGVGAAIYSPAKYGILPELASHQALVKANSWVEGTTILAILSGTVFGAYLADISIDWTLLSILLLLFISMLVAAFLPVNAGFTQAKGWKILIFIQEISLFFRAPKPRFAVLAGSLFWGTAACVRVILIAWAPLVLFTQTASEIAQLTFFLAIGIVFGSLMAPSLMPLERLGRIRYPAYIIGILIIALSFIDQLWFARTVLILLGLAGGIFIVPINAALQALGKQSIGSGGAVAMQNFFQNVAMLFTVGGYTLITSWQVSPSQAFLGLGCIELILALILMSQAKKLL